ncbi:MAG: hypothetical protein Q9224_006802, partial [Gallowayella concinna]
MRLRRTKNTRIPTEEYLHILDDGDPKTPPHSPSPRKTRGNLTNPRGRTWMESDLESLLQKQERVYVAYLCYREEIWGWFAEKLKVDWKLVELILTEQGGLNEVLKSKKVLYDQERQHFEDG